MSSLSTALPLLSDQSSTGNYTRDLFKEIVKDSSQIIKVTELKGENAQCIADFLSAFLHEDGAFTSEEGRQFFGLLKSLVKSSEVLPQCYKLRDLRCDFSQVREGGRFADIFKGEYRRRNVCVKAVRMFQKEDNSRMLQTMAKEAVLWAHLTHGNILPFYGVYTQQSSGRICIISPWMDRGDLSAYLSKFPDTPRLPLVLDIIAGLRYLHASGIVHGDLKAKNVLISDNGHALLADFGISSLLASTNSASSRLSNGSTRWMAPELFLPGNVPTLYSDMWSFGCVCQEVFTRKVPFADQINDFQILSILAQSTCRPGDVNQFEGVSIKGRELMDKCWNREPKPRPSSEEMYEYLVGERDDLEVQDVVDVQDVALWKAVRGGSGMIVDHARAHHIIRDIRGSYEYPHDSTPSIYLNPTTPNLGLNSSDASIQSPPGGFPFLSGLFSPSQISFATPGLPSDFFDLPDFLAEAFPGSNDSPADLHHKDDAVAISATQKLRKDDIIIAFMGPTGAGKSYFIDLLTGQKGQRAGNSLKSVTSQIQATRVRRQGYGDRIVLVDTPGFDDTTRSDMETLQIISDWLQKTYLKAVKLSGLIYLHRIIDNRVAGSPYKNIRMFGELCGDVVMTQVRLVTTMWGKVKPETGEAREKEVRERFWKHFIDKGSKIERLRDTTGEEAWRIVDGLIHDCKKRDAVLLQEELVELEKQLNETAAGRTLYTSLQKLLADQKESLRSLLAQIEKSNDPHLAKELKKEYARTNDQFQRTFQEVEKLKIPIGRRVIHFFFGKKTRAQAIKVSAG